MICDRTIGAFSTQNIAEAANLFGGVAALNERIF